MAMHNWDLKAKPWKNLLKVTDTSDRNLFICSTITQIGNGRSKPFWEARWLQGVAPRDLALNLYRITKFKKRRVHSELSNCNWIRSLQEIQTATQLKEFTLLFMALSPVSLTDQEGSLTWRWTSNVCYSVASAFWEL
jgi:hypothetical protein